MKKFHTLSLALFAAFAFSAIASSSAFAADEWLKGGSPLTGEVPSVVKESITIGAKTLLGEVELKCSGSFAGTLTTAGKDLIEDVLNLSGEVINELAEPSESTSLSIDCEIVVNGPCGNKGELALVWVDNLSLELGTVWTSKLELMTGEVTLDVTTGQGAGKEPGFEVKCPTGVENLCEGPFSAVVENLPNELPVADVTARIIKSENEKLTCNTGTGFTTGEGLIVIVEAGKEVATAIN